MPRKLRFEQEGAVYHVLNRGNSRAEVFGTEGAKTAFLQCLDEADEGKDDGHQPLAGGGVAHGQPARGQPPGGGFTAEDYRPQDLTLLNFPEVRN